MLIPSCIMARLGLRAAAIYQLAYLDNNQIYEGGNRYGQRGVARFPRTCSSPTLANTWLACVRSTLLKRFNVYAQNVFKEQLVGCLLS